jgi:hypothetical protein
MEKQATARNRLPLERSRLATFLWENGFEGFVGLLTATATPNESFLF